MTIEQQNDIIRILKEVDGDTIQYILKKIMMEEQMCNQLIMTRPIDEVVHKVSERFELEKDCPYKLTNIYLKQIIGP